jgi:hypothetical protein
MPISDKQLFAVKPLTFVGAAPLLLTS